MNCSTTQLPYTATGYFSKLVTDYLQQSPTIQPFYQHAPTIDGIRKAIAARAPFPGHREVLVDALRQQYKGATENARVQQNIGSLLQPNTFTICTAHQPAIFTGHLYFVYKILHIIKLANHLKQQLPDYHFVPVFWMGSEDADLDELGQIFLSGDTLTWDTKQTGAVGRMNTKGLEKIIQRIEGELSVQPHGKELLQLLKEAYLNSPDIQTATFKFLHALFAEYGLVVLIPDHAGLKSVMTSVFKDDLLHQTASSVVEKTIDDLSQVYKVQANPRPINLFYLMEGVRELIELEDGEYKVRNTEIRFTPSAIEKELETHPERFSPNVILRGLYQETVLPNLAFIGGGGETAYWLELKDLFQHYKVPYPLLVLRNSFLIVEEKWQEKVNRLGLTLSDIFQPEQQLLTLLVKRQSNGHLKLAEELQAATDLYNNLRVKAGQVDETLLPHIEALEARTIKPLQELEKKMIRAEKKKYEHEHQQIRQVKEALFPRDGLQERVENMLPYYAGWGRDFLQCIYNSSLHFEQQFVVITI